MKHRSEVVKIYREHIGAVNDEWNLTGKEFAFGEYIEDINPEYSKLVYDRIQPLFFSHTPTHKFRHSFKVIKDLKIPLFIFFVHNPNLLSLKEL
mgnify:CR=1 FL=1